MLRNRFTSQSKGRWLALLVAGVLGLGSVAPLPARAQDDRAEDSPASATEAVAEETEAAEPEETGANVPYNVNPLEDLQNANEVDPFTGSNSGFSMFDIIHRANLGGDVEYDRDSINRQLEEDAANFRTRQLERLRQQQEEGSSETP